MVTMAVAYEEIPVRPGGFTIADLEEMPADGRRYELLDGVLLVSPPPRWEHQWGMTELHRVLDACCPADLHAFPVPLEVSRLWPGTAPNSPPDDRRRDRRTA
jgi:hypothetical protein